MSPLEQIKTGVLNGDLALVAKGYAVLTGEHIEPPNNEAPEQPKKKRGRPKKAIPLPDPEPVVIELEEEEVEVDEDLDVAKRANEVRAAHRVDIDQFRTKVSDVGRRSASPVDPVPEKRSPRNQEEEEEEKDGNRSTPLPFEPPKGNKFIDNGKIAAADKEIDKKLSGKLQPTERRPPTKEPKKIKVKCEQCSREFKVPEYEAVRSNGEENMEYVCVGCIRKNVKD